MPVYAYKGVTATGKSTRGHLDAESIRGARAKLRRDGIFLSELAEQRAQVAARSVGPRFRLPSFQRIAPLELAVVTRQAATLIGSGPEAMNPNASVKLPKVNSRRSLSPWRSHPSSDSRRVAIDASSSSSAAMGPI